MCKVIPIKNMMVKFFNVIFNVVSHSISDDKSRVQLVSILLFNHLNINKDHNFMQRKYFIQHKYE